MISYAVGLISILINLKAFFEIFKAYNSMVLGVLLFIDYIVVGPALGLLFLHVGTQDEGYDYYEESQEKSYGTVYPKTQVELIISSNDLPYVKINKIKELYEKSLITREDFDEAVNRIKSK